jgi:hypothetical protein
MSMTVEQISVIAQMGLAPPGSVAGSQGVATDLALWQSALDSTALGTIDNAFAAALLNQSGTITETVIDPATLNLMFRVVDMRTGNVVSEEPVGAQLQLQELAQLLARGSMPAAAQATVSINIQA